MRILVAATMAVSALAIGAMALFSPAVTQSAPPQQQPFVGELKLTGYGACPVGWMPADGQLLPVAGPGEALFALYGTAFGGDGETNFALPDLRGSAPIHMGQAPGMPLYTLGQRSSETSFTLTIQNMPSHSHTVHATNQMSDKGGPQDRYLGAGVGADDIYHDGPANKTMAAGMIDKSGGGEPVNYRGPFVVMQWCVAVDGIQPVLDRG
ncbi:phage tail protein [Aquisalinus flavus]|nr:tail fiber protein [Aquisalinus flavus]MBD0426973.1 tail fiber protein [Aquisalinus flavus]